MYLAADVTAYTRLSDTHEHAHSPDGTGTNACERACVENHADNGFSRMQNARRRRSTLGDDVRRSDDDDDETRNQHNTPISHRAPCVPVRVSRIPAAAAAVRNELHVT